ncbi:MAG: ribosome-associated translation inhibitor RaiA [Planctomycetes bacterium]|nr:ribosome-associated translation inhibitor RaiA [Planctomycetota bacterium]
MSEETDVTIEFKGRHDHISERMQTHAARKLSRLAIFTDSLTRIEVVADHAHKNPEIELIVHQRRGNPLVAKGKGTSFSATIDLLVDKVEAQLRKLKEKRKDHKIPAGKASRESAKGGKGGGRSAAAKGRKGEDETYEEVVRKALRS